MSPGGLIDSPRWTDKMITLSRPFERVEQPVVAPGSTEIEMSRCTAKGLPAAPADKPPRVTRLQEQFPSTSIAGVAHRAESESKTIRFAWARRTDCPVTEGWMQ